MPGLQPLLRRFLQGPAQTPSRSPCLPTPLQMSLYVCKVGSVPKNGQVSLSTDGIIDCYSLCNKARRPPPPPPPPLPLLLPLLLMMKMLAGDSWSAALPSSTPIALLLLH